MHRIMLLIFTMVLAAMQHVAADDPANSHFRDKVKPLLESRCITCHHVGDAKGGLRLDSREMMLKGGDSGPAILIRHPGKSLILQAVMHSNKLQMPPKEKLNQQEIAILEKWIREGAPWPATEAVARPNTKLKKETLGNAWTDARNPVAKLWNGQRLDLWSMKPVNLVKPPPVAQTAWVRNPIDQFILAKLESRSFLPSNEADRRTLVRRLYLDITGMPPHPAELEAFLADSSPDAYERLVDRLLSSQAYGEHWARMWLDVVRYSDSNGFDWDEYRPRAWRFRDYVIRSLNSDKPYDRFIHEQLAGDELVDGFPKSVQEQDALIATGFLRIGPQDNSAPLFNEQARARAELMADLTDTTASAFLGLTYSCCRCHDHKYDPLMQADYYRLRAFFEPVKYLDDKSIDLAHEQAEQAKHNARIDKELATLENVKTQLTSGPRQQLLLLQRGILPSGGALLLQIIDSSTDKQVRSKLKPIVARSFPQEKHVLQAIGTDKRKQFEVAVLKISQLQASKRSPALALMMTDDEKIPPTHILYQGDYRAPRNSVEPGIPSLLDPNDLPIQKPVSTKTTGRRLTLARWITSPQNPLTARVMVNRIWQGYFGRGLVETPNDFGYSGSRPSHPELLDWLATSFMNGSTSSEKWSMKSLHRLIVTSATYRQAAYVSETTRNNVSTDAENTLYWRQNPRRLTAEQLRDSLLAVSSLMKVRQGGPPIWPVLPPEILQANPAFLDDNAQKTKGWYQSPADLQQVRSIYLVQKRTVRVPFLETFDQPENMVSCARRNAATVAPQALSLLNGHISIEAARALAQRVMISAGSDARSQVTDLYRYVVQRTPTQEERAVCMQYLQKHTITELARVLLNANEFIYRD